jgi:hypothetical protein
MGRLVALALLVLAVNLAPPSAWAQGVAAQGSSETVVSGRMRPAVRPSPHRPRVHHRPQVHHRPRPPIVPFFSCCADFSDFPDAPPPIVVPPPPTVIYIVPSPPTLVYIPTPRVEPAPEIAGPKGTWARHGNGKEYPYTWVFQPAPPAP